MELSYHRDLRDEQNDEPYAVLLKVEAHERR